MKKILILGDQQSLAEKGRSILSRPYLQVFTASTAEEALDIHNKEIVDLIIADLVMSGMDGDELCSLLRKKRTGQEVSIILVCTNKTTAIKRCEASGANACLTVPVDPAELMKIAVSLLRISERKGMRVLTKLAVDGEAKEQFFLAYSQNISTTGILLLTDNILDKGDRITVSFYLRSRQITIKGEITRSVKTDAGPFQYGVKFVNMDRRSKRMIEDFIESGHIGGSTE